MGQVLTHPLRRWQIFIIVVVKLSLAERSPCMTTHMQSGEKCLEDTIQIPSYVHVFDATSLLEMLQSRTATVSLGNHFPPPLGTSLALQTSQMIAMT